MVSRLSRLLAAAALTFFLIGAMASTSFADSSNSNAGGNGKSAEHANANAGANENAANNPHAQEAEDEPAANEEAASNESSAQAASSESTASAAATTTAGNKNAGCNQTPYGSGGNGANTSGPYNDTCDGSASQNGNGGGEAKGKPCAGCVGKADEKNPPGQLPGPSDKNKGYECDSNKGIGKGNPAHTGCTTTDNPPPPGDEEEEEEGAEVEGETLTRVTPGSGKSTGVPIEVLGEVFERPAGTLALTGSNTLAQAAFGTSLVLFGAALAAAARRRPATVKVKSD